jgi:hypothetical protein
LTHTVKKVAVCRYTYPLPRFPLNNRNLSAPCLVLKYKHAPTSAQLLYHDPSTRRNSCAKLSPTASRKADPKLPTHTRKLSKETNSGRCGRSVPVDRDSLEAGVGRVLS